MSNLRNTIIDRNFNTVEKLLARSEFRTGALTTLTFEDELTPSDQIIEALADQIYRRLDRGETKIAGIPITHLTYLDQTRYGRSNGLICPLSIFRKWLQIHQSLSTNSKDLIDSLIRLIKAYTLSEQALEAHSMRTASITKNLPYDRLLMQRIADPGVNTLVLEWGLNSAAGSLARSRSDPINRLLGRAMKTQTPSMEMRSFGEILEVLYGRHPLSVNQDSVALIHNPILKPSYKNMQFHLGKAHMRLSFFVS